MAFPSVNSTNISSENSNTTTHTVSLPSTVGAGDLLYVEASINGIPTVTDPSGWTLLLSQNGSTNLSKGLWWAKVADGTEGGTTITFTTSAGEESAHASYAISDWFGTLAGIEVSAAATGSGSSPNPPSMTASWGSDDNLFIASVNARRGDRAVTAFPTSYTDNQLQIETGTTGGGAGTGVATRNLSLATDDPAVFTLSSGTPWICATLVVRPAGGGGGISGAITQTTNSFTQSLVGTVVNPTTTGTITQAAQSFTQAAIGTNLLNITGTITQSASAFTQSLSGTVVANITGAISQNLSSFAQSLLGSVSIPVTGNINQTASSFTQSAIGLVPVQWVDKLPVSTTWTNQAETVTNWTDQTGVSTIWTDKV